MEFQNYILGIDFGTTYSCMAVWKDGGLVIIPNGIGERTTPSVVIFDDIDKVFVGEETLSHLPKNDSVKIYEIKRLLGKRYDQIQNILKYLPYKIIQEENGNRPMIEMKFGKKKSLKYYPEQIATIIFKKLISNAENFLSKKVREVLITVPADFTELQKNAVRQAAEQIEGLKVLQVINEPSAAILAYGFPKQYLKDKFYPFNKYFSLIKLSNEIHPMEEMSMQEISNSNLNESLRSNSIREQNSLLNENEIEKEKENDETNENIIINTNTNNNLNNSLINCNKPNQNQDKMKIIVFDFGGGTYDVSLIYVDNNKNFETMAYKGDENLGGSDFDNKLIDYCLKEFCVINNLDEKILKENYKLLQRLKIACEETKKVLSMKEEDIIYIGDFFETKPLCCLITRKKFEELCNDLFLRLIKPLDLILEEKNLNNTDIDEIIFVGGSSKIPKVRKIIQEKFPTVQINDQISPDEAVAYGACIYGESLRRIEGDFWKDFTYIDRTGHSYGIEIEDGTVEVIIPKGIRYPTSKTHYFQTVYDNQYTFDIRVFEGERKYAYENEFIGEFTLEGIPKRPKGEIILKVTMKIEKNQSIKITGLVRDGNIKKNLTIHRNNQYPKIKENDNIILKINELNIEEREIQSFIFEYSKNFVLQKQDKDKYDLIKKYNSAIIRYLNFFEKNYEDTSSEKYLYLLEKLFKSYTYFFNTSLFIFVDLDEKREIKMSIESYLQKISNKAPFRIKQLLMYFENVENVENEVFIERLEIAVFSMELIYNKAIDNFNKNEKNHILFAKTLFEECLSIEKSFIKEEEHSKMDIEILKKYNNIKKDSDKKIKLISAISLLEIENLKNQGRLFNNENKLEKDDLNLLSFNLDLAIKKLNTIENLNENQEALETKSFYLANLVKIEYLKIEKNMNLELMEQKAQESISIAKNLKKDCKNKPWFKEVVKLQDDIIKKLKNVKPAPPVEMEDIDDIEDNFMSLFDQGDEVLLRYILKKFPYKGYTFDEKSIDEYKKNKIQFLYDLRKKYDFRAYMDIISVNTTINTNKNDINSQVNDTILEYIDKLIDKAQKEFYQHFMKLVEVKSHLIY